MVERSDELRPRAHATPTRDAGLRRLRRLSVAVTAGAAALTGIFAGLGAASVPGRKLGGTAPRPQPRTAPRRVRHVEARVPAPPLPAEGAPAAARAPAPAPAPAPPAAPPAPTQAPPVVASGGS